LNDYLLSLLLGVVEGVTEFLPVSSTAHLRIAESLLHVSLSDGYWKMYSIVIQLGAILCLPVYFRERIAKFLSTFPGGERGDRNLLTHPLGLTMVAFVVTAIPSYLLTKVIGNDERIAIVGMAGLLPGALDLTGFWENVRSAVDCSSDPPPGRREKERAMVFHCSATAVRLDRTMIAVPPQRDPRLP
jgi:undecaprenyl-diphosphatase